MNCMQEDAAETCLFALRQSVGSRLTPQMLDELIDAANAEIEKECKATANSISDLKKILSEFPHPCGIVLRCKEVQRNATQKTTIKETTVLPETSSVMRSFYYIKKVLPLLL